MVDLLCVVRREEEGEGAAGGDEGRDGEEGFGEHCWVGHLVGCWYSRGCVGDLMDES